MTSAGSTSADEATPREFPFSALGFPARFEGREAVPGGVGGRS